MPRKSEIASGLLRGLAAREQARFDNAVQSARDSVRGRLDVGGEPAQSPNDVPTARAAARWGASSGTLRCLPATDWIGTWSSWPRVQTTS